MTEQEKDTYKKQFGKNIRKIRKDKRLSLLQLSYRCDIDNSNISKIEHGRFDIRLSTILELSKGLDVAPKDLLDIHFDLDTK